MPTASYNLEIGAAGVAGSCANPLPWQFQGGGGYEDGGPFIPPCPSSPNLLNLAPVVNAGQMQAVLPGNPATLTGIVTDDGLPSDGYLTQIWTQTSGPAAVIANPTSLSTGVSLPTSGTYGFLLSATDGQLASSSAVQIVVTNNLPPVVNAGANQNVLLPATITLTGTETDDGVPGTGLTSMWTQLSGPTATINNPSSLTTTVSAAQVGTAVFRLIGSDGQLSSFSDTSVMTRYRAGTSPWNPLIQGTDGKLYGVANKGGISEGGAAFVHAINGTPSGIHNFVSGEGLNPVCSLIQATDGNFYGLTTTTLFKLTPTGLLTVLHTFDANVIQTQTGLNSSASAAGIMQASDGNIYGGTYYGGASSLGQIFKCTLGGTFSVLYSLNGTDGSYVTGTPAQGPDGALYFPARQGNASNYGAIMRVTFGGVASVIFSFNNALSNGIEPINALCLANDGNFYGVTNTAKIGNAGAIYKLTSSGTLTPLYTIGGANNGVATSALIQATDGNFYGSRYDFGDLNAGGAIYKLTPTGTYSVLHGFTGTDGSIPTGVMQAQDGNFYGTTRLGGANGNGVLYRLALDGTFTILYQFPTGQ